MSALPLRFLTGLVLPVLVSCFVVPAAVAYHPNHLPIWKLSDEDSTVFLAGSVHLLRESDLPIPSGFDEVYRNSEEVVFEIDMATMMSPAMALRIRELGTLPEGESLESRIGPDAMVRIRDYLGKRSLPENLFDRFTPGMAYITIGSLEATRLGARPDLGLEVRYYRKSVNDNKPSRGLETAEYQISLFKYIDDEFMTELILETLEETDDASQEDLDEIIDAWKSGDAMEMETMIVEKMGTSETVQDAVLFQRNENWIEPIIKALEGSSNVMFLVGAAHLAGEKSVVDLLEKRGFVVEQLSAED
ncbi:MAG: TraB/GumN family protein [Verrucomicrobiota bacterium]